MNIIEVRERGVDIPHILKFGIFVTRFGGVYWNPAFLPVGKVRSLCVCRLPPDLSPSISLVRTMLNWAWPTARERPRKPESSSS